MWIGDVGRVKPGGLGGQAAPAPDLVQREFVAEAPNRLWVADTTYLRTWEGWLFLAVVIDAFSRKVVGYAMSDRFDAELVIDAFADGQPAAQTCAWPTSAPLRSWLPMHLICLRAVFAPIRGLGLHGQHC